MHLSTANTPGIPGCFEDTTPIQMKDASIKKIVDVEVGDELYDGSIVTGIMKLSSAGQSVYNLHNVIVTGEHRVALSADCCQSQSNSSSSSWIKVKDHPDSKIVDFNKPYVYCLMTDTKSFIIKELLFSDWDDIDDKVIEKLTENCVSKGYIPPNFTNSDIHAYLDNGLCPSTKIKLINGREITINNVKVNDILIGGETVVGTVKIDATKLKGGVYDYKFDDGISIRCSNNITINNYLGGINTFELYGNPILDEPPCIYLYQLLTSTGSFNANGLIIGDYNKGIDNNL
jgi:hypothetical protein